jgi:penicillin-binding protein 1C
VAANGHIVSGGSTITMQVARIIDPQPRTVKGKLIQIAGMQLKCITPRMKFWSHIITRRWAGAEGVEAASRGYLGKPSSRLTCRGALRPSAQTPSPLHRTAFNALRLRETK